jgi:NADH-quinone oxidoreductase subunit I
MEAMSTSSEKPLASKPRDFGFLQTLYLKEILAGLVITIRHLVTNIWNNLRKQDAAWRTVEYPDVKKPMPERYKGAHRLTTRPDGKVKCVACMCCAQACPARCITIEAGEDDGDAIEKFPVEFQIDMLRCIYCGFCVEACPKDAIRMDTGIYEINAFTRQDMVHNKAYMVDLMSDLKPEAEDFYRENRQSGPAGFNPDEKQVI